MNSKNLIVILGAIIIMLTGIIIGQNFSLNKEMDANNYSNTSKNQNSEFYNNTKQSNNVHERIGPERESLHPEQYWISENVSEENIIGFSTWIVLRAGGDFIIEKCLPPKYEKKGNAVIDNCETSIEGKLVDIQDSFLKIRNKKNELIEMEFKLNKNAPKLDLKINNQWAILIPGSKNTLISKFQNFPSVKMARQAWMKHMVTK